MFHYFSSLSNRSRIRCTGMPMFYHGATATVGLLAHKQPLQSHPMKLSLPSDWPTLLKFYKAIFNWSWFSTIKIANINVKFKKDSENMTLQSHLEVLENILFPKLTEVANAIWFAKIHIPIDNAQVEGAKKNPANFCTLVCKWSTG